MIYTLTGNLLAERTVEVGRWHPGQTQRASSERFQVGGKGINVARMLSRLRSPCIALAFTGGAAGAECEAWFRRQTVRVRTFATSTATRSGLVVRGENQPETTFLGPDAPPDEAALSACAAFLERVETEAFVALCGSFPGWSEPAAQPVRAALAAIAQRGRLVVDSYGPPLLWATAQPAALLKINRSEFAGLLPTGSTESSAHAFERMRTAMPVQTWILTDGREPVWLGERDRATERFDPPTTQEVSATGSGDVFLACVLHAALAEGKSWRDAVEFALPLAAANTAHPGVAAFAHPLLELIP